VAHLKGNLVKAVRVHEFGPPEVMVVEELPDPVPGFTVRKK